MMNNKILRVDASIRKTGSYSRELTDNMIKQLTSLQNTNVKARDLADGVPMINEAWIGANFTDVAERTTEQRAVLACSDALIAEVQEADVLVIGLPIYNFSVPAAFKAWIDQIARAKVTFRYTDKGPVGLLDNKKAYVIITSGGTKLGSEIDFVSEYIHHILGFIGIKEVTIIDSSAIGRDEKKVLSAANNAIQLSDKRFLAD
jgi:FMN-dependent NADH-azoreductase